MTPDQEITHAISNVMVEVSPREVDAAAELTLQARVSFSPPLNLRGQALLIKDHDGAIVGNAELVEFDGETNETAEIVVQAPTRVGSYSWSAVCPAMAADGISFEEKAEPFAIVVTPHATRIVVWDVPPAVVVGEKFRLKVGLKCSSGCQLEGREVAIFDNAGALAATGRVGGDHWPGSTALHVAELELEAPVTEGSFQWEARVVAAAIKVPGLDVEIPHEERSSSFGVRFVPAPESLVRVRVIDQEKQNPLKGASVVMLPYRAVTDDDGWAEMRVAKGQYRLLVSQSNYLARGLSLEVTGDVTTTAELDVEPVTNPYDMYY